MRLRNAQGKGVPLPIGTVCLAIGLFTSCITVRASEPNSTKDAPHSERDSVVTQPVYLFMLTNELIRSDLALSAEQRDWIRELQEEYLRTLVSAGSATDSDSVSKKEGKQLDGAAAAAARSQAFEQRIKRVLSSSQLVRLEQLWLRARGFWVVFEPSVRTSLGIRESQLDAARRIIDSCRAECQTQVARVRRGEMSVKEAQLHVDKRMQQARKKVFDCLDDKQRDELQRLLGTPPTFDPGKLRFRLSRVTRQ